MFRWIAAAGALVVSLDSMMNIAFPAIAAAFAAPPERVRWIIICYVLTYAITAFAGSMWFVYIHVGWFILWLRWEPFKDVFPYGLLTMIVSLEAIFLSTFVMISQNRADEKRQVLAAQEWQSVQLEEKQNEQLLDLSKQILELTDSIHRLTVAHTGGPGPAPDVETAPSPA